MGRLKTHEERLHKIQRNKAIKQLQTKGIKMTPRTMKEINDEYGLVCAQLGDVTNKLEAQKAKAEEFLSKLKSLSAEASQRDQLDKAAAQPTSVDTTPSPEKEETENVQV
jgi:hypothetical protein